MDTQHSRQYFAFENHLINNFPIQPALSNMPYLSKPQFEEMIRQGTHFTFDFVPRNTKTMNGTRSEDVFDYFLHINHEELGIEEDSSKIRREPPHIRLLFHDLALMGISKESVYDTELSPYTQKAIEKLWSIIPKLTSKYYDLEAMVGSRISGERLVGKYYELLVSELDKRYELNEQNSKFYVPHYLHDSECGSHTKGSENILRRLITSEKELNIAKEVAKEAYKARALFHLQFTKSYWDYLDMLGESLVAVSGHTINNSEMNTEHSFVQYMRMIMPELKKRSDEEIVEEVFCTPEQKYFDLIKQWKAVEEQAVEQIAAAPKKSNPRKGLVSLN